MTNHWQIIESVLEDERDRHIINGGKAEHRKELDAALAFVREQRAGADTRLRCAICGDQLESTSVCEVCFELQPPQAERGEWEPVPNGIYQHSGCTWELTDKILSIVYAAVVNNCSPIQCNADADARVVLTRR